MLNNPNHTIRLLLSTLLLLWLTCGQATEPLPMEQAFQFSATNSNNTSVLLQWKIAPGYYLYRDKTEINSTDTHLTLGEAQWPEGKIHQDEFFGSQVIYDTDAQVPIPYNADAQTTHFTVRYQGCATAGFCYPPVTQDVAIEQNATGPLTITTVGKPRIEFQDDEIDSLFHSNNIFVILISFFGFGVLLAFTPCVLPMLPILSSIIIGQKEQVTIGRAFSLSSSYVLGMSSAYATAGALTGYVGGSLAAHMQKPWVIIGFSLVFVVLALSMFGLYEIRMPSRINDNAHKLSHKPRSGTYLGAFVMGFLSLLIVSPCVSAPLVGALSYIAQTGDPWLGSAALFSLGLGSGAILIVISVWGSSLLPKPGPWMDATKAMFGVFLLGMALYLLARLLPGQVTLILWSLLFIISAVQMGLLEKASSGWARIWRGLALAIAIYGAILLVGAATGGHDPLRPLANLHHNKQQSTNTIAWQTIKSDTALKQALAQANNKPVFIDYYADWCVSCKIMERTTFADPAVQAKLKDYVTLKADVTANDADSQALLKQFDVIAPPTMIILSDNNKKPTVLVGETDAETLLQHL